VMANPRMNLTDVAWVVLFMAIYLPVMTLSILGGAFLLAALHVPGTENNGLVGLAEVIFLIWLVVGIVLSWLLALWLYSQLTSRYLSQETYDRWRQQFDNGTPGWLVSWLGSYALRTTEPGRQRHHDV
jgi:multidrug efflux pump subunit AcrB